MDKNIKISSNKSFGIVFFIVFFIISIYPLFNNGDLKVSVLIISLTFLTLGLLNSPILSPLNKLWFKFGILLGSIVSPIVMGIVFFGVVTPTSIIMKIFRKNLLSLKKNNKKTYWIEKPLIKSKMKNQF
jgi:polyferredoxin